MATTALHGLPHTRNRNQGTTNNTNNFQTRVIIVRHHKIAKKIHLKDCFLGRDCLNRTVPSNLQLWVVYHGCCAPSLRPRSSNLALRHKPLSQNAKHMDAFWVYLPLLAKAWWFVFIIQRSTVHGDEMIQETQVSLKPAPNMHNLYIGGSEQYTLNETEIYTDLHTTK